MREIPGAMPAGAVDVLVVDDNEALLELAARALKRAGFTVATAESFTNLDLVLASAQPRLILMDVQMPELFGDEVASILRNELGVAARIVLYSSLDTQELAKLSQAAGIDGYISKSEGIEHLVAQVRGRLAK